MTLAKQLLSLIEASKSPAQASDLKPGDHVEFAPGSEHEGLPALVLDVKGELVDLRVGSATKLEVPVSDLLKIDQAD